MLRAFNGVKRRNARSVGRPAGGERRAGGGRPLLFGSPGGCRRAGHQDRAARRAISRAATTATCTASPAISSGSIAASSRSTLDFKEQGDLALLHRMIAQGRRADPEPGAGRRRTRGLRLGRDAGRETTRLITVDISGYGDHGPYKNRRAYDLLVQAESGLASITGTEHAPGRVGVSATDIGTGMYAHAAVLEALIARQKTGEGRAIRSRCSRRWPNGWRCRCSPRTTRQLRVAAARPHASLHRALWRLSDGDNVPC